MKLFEDEKFYGEISLKFDSTKKGEKQQQIVKGDEVTISSLIGALIHNLIESGFDRHLLEHAIEQGLNESKKKEFEELLKKITGEDK